MQFLLWASSLYAVVAGLQDFPCEIIGGFCDQPNCLDTYPWPTLCPSDQACCIKGNNQGLPSEAECAALGGTCQASFVSCDGVQTSDSNCSKPRICCIPAAPPVTNLPWQSIEINMDGCGISSTLSSDIRITGGTNSEQDAWPWQAAIFKGSKFICGASILGGKWVVTAAHCFNGTSTDPAEFSILTATNRIQDGSGVSISVDQIIRHPDWQEGDKEFNSDIALVKLAEKANVLSSICVSDDEDSFAGNEECWVTGWGVSDLSESEKPEVLQQASGTVLSNLQCIPWIGKILPGMVCFGGNGVGTCDGDSGGPLVCKKNGKFNLVGITSFGLNPCGAKPCVFTRVSSWSLWLYATMAGNM